MRTKDVAMFAVDTDRARITDEVEEWSRWVTLDLVSVLLAGHATTTAQAATKTAARSTGAASVTGTGVRTIPAMAAFADAVAANALDFEDGHIIGGGIHAGSTVLPAVLAVAEPSTRLAEVRRALVVGYEVAIRAGYLMSAKHSGQHYRASGHAACLGATAALGALLGLDAQTVGSSLRVAASHAPVSTMHSAGARESIGWAAATAVTSVFLAIDGYTDAAADEQLLAPVSPTPFDDASGVAFIESLGERYEALNCYVKPFACCRVAHAALDALCAILAGTRVQVSDIESVTVYTVAEGALMDNRHPLVLEQAQFSIPITVATYLLYGRIGPEEASARVYRSGAVNALADRVQVVHDPTLDARSDGSYPARVELGAGGRSYQRTVLHAWGSAANPLSHDDRLDKAIRCLTSVLPDAFVPEIVDLLLSPGDGIVLADLRQLTEASSYLVFG